MAKLLSKQLSRYAKKFEAIEKITDRDEQGRAESDLGVELIQKLLRRIDMGKTHKAINLPMSWYDDPNIKGELRLTVSEHTVWVEVLTQADIELFKSDKDAEPESWAGFTAAVEVNEKNGASLRVGRGVDGDLDHTIKSAKDCELAYSKG